MTVVEGRKMEKRRCCTSGMKIDGCKRSCDNRTKCSDNKIKKF